MLFLKILWVTRFQIIFFILMVSCNAPGCSWDKTTDTGNRGLSKHRAACRFYKRVSTLANQKRQDRAKDATASNFLPNPSVSYWLSNATSASTAHLSTLENFSRPKCEGPSELEANRTSQASQANVHGLRVTQRLHSRRLTPRQLREPAKWSCWCRNGEQLWRRIGLLWCRFVYPSM